MTCAEIRDLFSARADAALTREEHDTLEGHLATCAECGRDWERFAATLGLLHAVQPARAPAGFVERVLAAAPRVPWYRRAARGLFVPWPVKMPLQAAAVVLVAGLAVMLFERSPDLQQAARAPEPGPLGNPTTEFLARPEAPSEHASMRAAPPATPPTPPPDVAARGSSPALDAAQARAAAPRANAESEFSLSGRPPIAAPPAEEPLHAKERQTADRRVVPSPTDSALEAMVPEPAMPPTGAHEIPRRSMSKLESVRVRRGPEVEVRLGVADRAAAQREIAALVGRLGGTVRPGATDSTLEITVPRDGYPGLSRELARLGTVRSLSEPAELPADVRLGVTLTD